MSLVSLTLPTALTLAALALPSEPTLETSLQDGLYPSPKGDLVLDVGSADQPTTMFDLLASYGDLTGQSFTYSDETEAYLRQTDLNLTRSSTVPSAQVQFWVENILAQNDFMLQPALRGSDPLTAVHFKGTSRVARDGAIFIDEQDLGQVKASPATMISTVVTLRNTDVRQLSNSTRTLVTDPNTQQVLPAGSSHSMILVGSGTWVADMASTLKQIDAAASPEQEAGSSPGVQMIRYQLEHVEAGYAAHLVESLVVGVLPVDNRPQGATSPPSPVQVLPDPRTGSLLVTIRADLVDRLEEAIALVDIEAAE